MRKYLLIAGGIIAVLIIGGIYIANRYTIKPSPRQSTLTFMQLPEGFVINVFADDLGSSAVSTPGRNPGPRLMALRGDEVFVSVPNRGSVFVLEDTDGDFVADSEKTFISGLRAPHGIAITDDWIYIAEENQLIRVKDADADGVAEAETKEVLLRLPTGGHSTRTVKVIGDKLYVAVGSSCNVCDEAEIARAAIQQCDLDGKNCINFASGLRNTVDFVEHEGKIYGTDNGRDMIGNDIPPDEVNLIEKGKNYGWPFCYGNNVVDTEFTRGKLFDEDPCTLTMPSFLDLQAHSAPLGLAFYTGSAFPKEYQGDLFIAYHGSWNRQPPTGYKIVVADPGTKEIKDFATGWFDGSIVKGRPVGIINYKNGLLVTDDNQGKIYFISYEGN